MSDEGNLGLPVLKTELRAPSTPGSVLSRPLVMRNKLWLSASGQGVSADFGAKIDSDTLYLYGHSEPGVMFPGKHHLLSRPG